MKSLHIFILGAATAVIVGALFSFSSKPIPTEEKKQHRIVFQMTTPDTAAYRALTRQINNVLAHWPDARIEVVSHNKGIGLLDKKKCNVQPEIGSLKAQGVEFVACEQTLKQQKLEKTDIIPEAGFVARGLVEIVEKQEQGWAYIKGGF